MLDKSYQLAISTIFTCIAYKMTKSLVPRMRDSFIRAHLVGVDVSKAERKSIPESMGVVAGCVFLIFMYLFIPIPFLDSWSVTRDFLNLTTPAVDEEAFDHQEFSTMLAALLSISCMLFLGFADDVLDLRWRHKLFLPMIAFIPLLMVYIVQYNETNVVIPKPLRAHLGDLVNLGPLYYLYMGMLVIFCTNAINILAGINGLEVGQSVVIGFSILVFNLMELCCDCWKAHLFSLTFIMPFLGVSVALLSLNWFPASVFVGDTYCYFAGMTFAVVGILGHFSKTMLLFFLPQIFNFLFSVPQLFHLIECPRHRLPRYDAKLDVMTPSTFHYDAAKTRIWGRIIISLYQKLGLIQVNEVVDADTGNRSLRGTNCTIINVMLLMFKPMKENNLTTCILVLQILFSLVAFFIRYGVSRFIY